MFLRRFMPKKGKFNIGLVVEEFFHEELRGFGGFGSTVKNISDYYNTSSPKYNFFVVLAQLLPKKQEPFIEKYHKANVLISPLKQSNPQRNLRNYLRLLGRLDPKVFLTIDYYPSYNYSLKAFPWTPVIIYIRDPRGPEEWARMGDVPLKLEQRGKNDKRQLIEFAEQKVAGMTVLLNHSRKFGRKIIFATNAKFLVERAQRTYGINDLNPYLLQNPMILPDVKIPEYSLKPSICFIGRLDAVKRFWIYFELAKHFPEVDFYVLGGANMPQLMNPIIKKYSSVKNLKLLGVTTGIKKEEILKNCWGLINTSIHEGLPVTFLESFSYGKCVVSCQNPENLVAKFGYYTGKVLGEGLDNASIELFCRQIESLLANQKDRESKGLNALEYMQKNHTFENFTRQLENILEQEKI